MAQRCANTTVLSLRSIKSVKADPYLQKYFEWSDQNILSLKPCLDVFEIPFNITGITLKSIN